MSDGLTGAGHLYAVPVNRYGRQLQRCDEHLSIFSEGQESTDCGRHVYNSLLSQGALQGTLVYALMSAPSIAFQAQITSIAP